MPICKCTKNKKQFDAQFEQIGNLISINNKYFINLQSRNIRIIRNGFNQIYIDSDSGISVEIKNDLSLPLEKIIEQPTYVAIVLDGIRLYK
ncbi:hypothetical protein SS50377_26596 [Spironucleus salmonicida]|uniref:Uncharacterized protein n=1 Tax=Spironucleus salmonicida TaxID=348837 RepID=A0A9P8LQK8_9EUKA|nr:hypothetical protein SS50377_26596 [Spironucleus salmonicida]